MLLAGLDREPVGGIAVRVHRHAHDAARDLAHVLLLGREIRRVRSAESHRHAESLRGSDRDVRSEFAGRHEQRERERVRGDDHRRTRGLGALRERAVILDAAVGGGVLEQDSAEVAGFEVNRVDGADL